MNATNITFERTDYQAHIRVTLAMVRSGMTLFLVAILALVVSTPLRAQILTDVPNAAKAVRVDEKLGESIRMDQSWLDDNGEPMSLAKISGGRLPILLTFNIQTVPVCALPN